MYIKREGSGSRPQHAQISSHSQAFIFSRPCSNQVFSILRICWVAHPKKTIQLNRLPETMMERYGKFENDVTIRNQPTNQRTKQWTNQYCTKVLLSLRETRKPTWSRGCYDFHNFSQELLWLWIESWAPQNPGAHHFPIKIIIVGW